MSLKTTGEEEPPTEAIAAISEANDDEKPAAANDGGNHLIQADDVNEKQQLQRDAVGLSLDGSAPRPPPSPRQNAAHTSQPGAYHVSGRAMGERPIWTQRIMRRLSSVASSRSFRFRRQQSSCSSNEDQHEDADAEEMEEAIVSPVPPTETKQEEEVKCWNERRILLTAIIVLSLVVIIGVVVGAILGTRSTRSSTRPAASEPTPNTPQAPLLPTVAPSLSTTISPTTSLEPTGGTPWISVEQQDSIQIDGMSTLGQLFSMSADATSIAAVATFEAQSSLLQENACLVVSYVNGTWNEEVRNRTGVSKSICELDSTGTILVIGYSDDLVSYLSRYEKDNDLNEWILKEPPWPHGIEAFNSASLSGDGSRLSFVARWENRTIVKVQSWVPMLGTWQVEEFLQDFDSDMIPPITKLSHDGSIFVMGKLEPINDTHWNIATAYQWNVNSTTYEPLGDSLQGQYLNPEIFQPRVEVSKDGSIVAVGIPASSNRGEFAGSVSIFQLQIPGGTWKQLGRTIEGGQPLLESGRSISLSSDGFTIAIGSPGPSSNGNQVKVYQWSGEAWRHVETILGEPVTAFGANVALSEDARTLAVGAPGTFSSLEFGSPGLLRLYRNPS